MNPMPSLPLTLPQPPAGRSGWPWIAPGQAAHTRLSHREWPRITVITPSFNQGRFLEETIRSVLIQGYPNLEYMVIDGGSTDNSIDVIRKYQRWITYWISEPDGGQPQAINKGLARATGDIFNFINSDDVLAPRSLFEIAAAMEGHDAVAGSIVEFWDGGPAHTIFQSQLESKRMLHKWHGRFAQSGLWLRRSRVEECGGIDEAFQFIFDWDLAVRYLTLFPDVVYLPHIVAWFRMHEVSKSVAHQDSFESERFLMYEKLLALPAFRSLHPACSRSLRAHARTETLARIRERKDIAAWRRTLMLLQAHVMQPGRRSR